MKRRQGRKDIEEDFDFVEMMATIMMDAKRKKAMRDAAQLAVERVVGRVGQFKGMMSQKIWELTMRQGRKKDGTRRASIIDASSVYGCHR